MANDLTTGTKLYGPYSNVSPTGMDYSTFTTQLSDSDWLKANGMSGQGLGWDSYYGNSVATPTKKDYGFIDSFLGKGGEDPTSALNAQRGAMGAVQAGLGVGQLGLGLASYLQQSDFMKKQGKLLDQQLASNQYEMDRRKGFSQALADAQKTNV